MHDAGRAHAVGSGPRVFVKAGIVVDMVEELVLETEISWKRA